MFVPPLGYPMIDKNLAVRFAQSSCSSNKKQTTAVSVMLDLVKATIDGIKFHKVSEQETQNDYLDQSVSLLPSSSHWNRHHVPRRQARGALLHPLSRRCRILASQLDPPLPHQRRGHCLGRPE
jgi:hypothetical protein